MLTGKIITLFREDVIGRFRALPMSEIAIEHLTLSVAEAASAEIIRFVERNPLAIKILKDRYKV